MRYFAFAAMVLAAGLLQAQERFTPKTMEEKKAYLIGRNIGSNFHHQMLSPNMDVLLKGILSGMKGDKSNLSEEEIQKVMKAIQAEIAANHKKAGEAFLVENKKKPGVKTTETGLQYKVLKEGTGKTPTEFDSVTVHYRGQLITGLEFDSSYRRKAPASFRANLVIKGWTEALQLMKEGGKLQLFIPAGLAYRDSPPAGSSIPPNAVLIFEVELLKVN